MYVWFENSAKETAENVDETCKHFLTWTGIVPNSQQIEMVMILQVAFRYTESFSLEGIFAKEKRSIKRSLTEIEQYE